jgi:hypothetical protein
MTDPRMLAASKLFQFQRLMGVPICDGRRAL